MLFIVAFSLDPIGAIYKKSKKGERKKRQRIMYKALVFVDGKHERQRRRNSLHDDHRWKTYKYPWEMYPN